MVYTKRLLSPKFYNVSRKQNTFVVTGACGPHNKASSFPLAIALRDVLKVAENISEAREILNKRTVKVDNNIRTDYKFPLGFMDVLSINDINYRILLNKKGLCIKQVDKAQSNVKLLKIVSKTFTKKNKLQLGFHDGRIILVDKDIYKVGDVVLFELESKKIKDLIQLKRGSTVLITEGKNRGKLGKVEDFVNVRSSQPNRIVVRFGDDRIETYKDYVFIVGHDSPVIDLQIE